MRKKIVSLSNFRPNTTSIALKFFISRIAAKQLKKCWNHLSDRTKNCKEKLNLLVKAEFTFSRKLKRRK